jgi:hypothetical protein
MALYHAAEDGVKPKCKRPARVNALTGRFAWTPTRGYFTGELKLASPSNVSAQAQ